MIKSIEGLAGHPKLRMIIVSGDEAGTFLNDILTAQVEALPLGLARAACLLSPQGRILFDMLVLKKGNTEFGLVTEEEQAVPLLKKLTFYRLRRKIIIKLETDFCFAHLWQNADIPGKNWRQFDDERHPLLGSLLVCNTTEVLPDDRLWQRQRISLGIPQGAADLTPNRALMLEAGLQLLGGVDFQKGCYIGQEVTARTHYRGLVKRRLLPVLSPEHQLKPHDEIYHGEKLVGICHSVAENGLGSIALAALRLDAVSAVQAGDGTFLSNEKPIEFSIPEWMQPLPGFDKDDANN